jgi:RNA polymerase sigma-70 factor (sigma-E family)
MTVTAVDRTPAAVASDPDLATFDVARNRFAFPRVGSADQRPGVMVSEQIGERDDVRAVFDEFARARMPELLRFGHALTGSPHAAADLVQDALERTMIAWPRVEKQGDPEGYVRRIMVNRNISIWRRHKREQLVDDIPEDVRNGVREPVVRDLALWERIKTLPPRQRTVIVLRYYEDMSEAQIAAIMGSSVGTVKSQASRALATLRRDSAQFAETDGEVA